MEIPDDLLPVGHVLGPFGVQGELRIKPYSVDADALMSVRRWWMDKPALSDVEVLNVRRQGEDVVAKLVGVVGRDAAEALKGAVVQVRRSHFPALANDEYYWVDLIGLRVVNLTGQELGLVGDLMDNGAHPILRVVVAGKSDDPEHELLIPFVDQFVKTVDRAAKQITVDWESDY
ncbi:MAG: rimM [Herminiimonas sp.]|jgi:16S rRNA processing protein RimM|nr:rimM [Herminiimonas sp.]MDB5854474.1 rimM [Herminiimonas sp.]